VRGKWGTGQTFVLVQYGPEKRMGRRNVVAREMWGLETEEAGESTPYSVPLRSRALKPSSKTARPQTGIGCAKRNTSKKLLERLCGCLFIV
jgi:hypothetical protein